MQLLIIFLIIGLIYYLNTSKKELFSIPNEEGIAYILDDYLNTNNVSFADYLIYLVNQQNRFPQLATNAAYRVFMTIKSSVGKVTTEDIQNYIKTH